ncbi:hypothetical protein [Fluviispira multicolorata]|uniref:Uncharacterized protein n=1 Tax=Fluviispira multicolorata TaxID=2654512 RepID=A0A833N2V5_9BACT|nr:hypothetical protein [Fluviispira multicolorata]KAB8029030.1 hypothetical protein GCL57_10840 [Fluviispira multicolorata]
MLTDILVCAGLGGTNMMIFKYGETFFGQNNGYAIALILYGAFYFIGGKIIELKNKGKEISLNVTSIVGSLIIIILSFFFYQL